MITCWLQRRRIEGALDSNATPSEATRAHLASCAQCRQFAEQHRSLAMRLRVDATASAPSLPAGLNARIQERLVAERAATRTAALPSPEPSASLWTLIMRPTAAASMALAVAVGIGLWMKFSVVAPTATTTSAARTPEPTPHRPLAAATESLGALPLKLTEPLETEMRSLIQDARSAASVLASHFTPTIERSEP